VHRFNGASIFHASCEHARVPSRQGTPGARAAWRQSITADRTRDGSVRRSSSAAATAVVSRFSVHRMPRPRSYPWHSDVNSCTTQILSQNGLDTAWTAHKGAECGNSVGPEWRSVARLLKLAAVDSGVRGLYLNRFGSVSSAPSGLRTRPPAAEKHVRLCLGTTRCRDRSCVGPPRRARPVQDRTTVRAQIDGPDEPAESAGWMRMVVVRPPRRALRG
jgi:hypothetical protein